MACRLGCRGRFPPPNTYSGALSNDWLLYLRISFAVLSFITRSRVVTLTGTGSDSARRLPLNCLAYVKSFKLDIITSGEPQYLKHTFPVKAAPNLATRLHALWRRGLNRFSSGALIASLPL